jgi:hypothetical protein
MQRYASRSRGNRCNPGNNKRERGSSLCNYSPEVTKNYVPLSFAVVLTEFYHVSSLEVASRVA